MFFRNLRKVFPRRKKQNFMKILKAVRGEIYCFMKLFHKIPLFCGECFPQYFPLKGIYVILWQTLSIYFVRFSTFPLNDSYYEFVAVFFVRLSTFLGMLLLYFGTDLSLSINHFLQDLSFTCCCPCCLCCCCICCRCLCCHNFRTKS